MPRIRYIDRNFSANSVALIIKAVEIIDDYRAQGYTLTVRQLYYQFVARDLIPNNQRSYKNLASVINDARLAGHIDWLAIEDRTRNLRAVPHWDTPADIIDTCVEQFRVDKWAEQRYAPEVWIEKDALVGVIEPVCTELDVPYFACRGYSSQSEQWRAGQRFHKARKSGRKPIVFHLGDHDPSGIDMTRDNDDRLSMFSDGAVEVHRLALNFDQVERYGPPPNPAKLTDSRAGGYVANYGDDSWELDALEPSVISDLIRQAVLIIRDQEAWDAAVEREDEARQRLEDVAAQLRDE